MKKNWLIAYVLLLVIFSNICGMEEKKVVEGALGAADACLTDVTAECDSERGTDQLWDRLHGKFTSTIGLLGKASGEMQIQLLGELSEVVKKAKSTLSDDARVDQLVSRVEVVEAFYSLKEQIELYLHIHRFVMYDSEYNHLMKQAQKMLACKKYQSGYGDASLLEAMQESLRDHLNSVDGHY